MSATGLDVFDKTLQTTHIWLDELMQDEAIGPDKHLAWHVLAAVLRGVRDRLPADLAAHLGSQLPILIRGVYYDQFRPSALPSRLRSLDEFLETVGEDLALARPVNLRKAARAALRVLSRHVNRGQIRKVRDSMPEEVRAIWQDDPEAPDIRDRPERYGASKRRRVPEAGTTTANPIQRGDGTMKIADVMTRDVKVIQPHRSVREAARLMDELNVGALPVCDGERLVGMITDRDITVRATAAGEDPDKTLVHEIMTDDVHWCFEDDDARDAARMMSDIQIRRLPVISHNKRLVGIVALGDLATDRAEGASEALRRISEPSEPDRSGTPSSRRAGQIGQRESYRHEHRYRDDEREDYGRYGGAYSERDYRDSGFGAAYRAGYGREDDRRNYGQRASGGGRPRRWH